MDSTDIKAKRHEKEVQEIRQRLNRAALAESLIHEIADLRLTVRDMSERLAASEQRIKARDVLIPSLVQLHSKNTRCRITADMALAASDGFYPIEFTGNGRAFRWTGSSNEFRFTFNINRLRPARVTLHIAVREHGRADLSCMSDGVEIPLRTDEGAGEIRLSGHLPPRDMVGPTIVRFRVPEMFVPSAANGASADARVLGVCFFEFTAESISAEQFEASMNDSALHEVAK